MIDYVPLIVAVVIAVGLVFIRTNAAVSFLAICAGSVLVSSSGENAGLIASSLTSGAGMASDVTKIVLLLLPMIVCSFLLKGQIAKNLFFINLLPAICAGLLTVLFCVPLLPDSVAKTVVDAENWKMLVQYQEFVIGAGLLLSVFLISITSKNRNHEKHKKH